MSFERQVKRLAREFGRSDGVATAIAADFLTGGSPTAAEIYDRKIGGLARGPSAGFPAPPERLPRGAVVLADIPPHPSQLEALELIAASRRVALVAGRRWGKTTLLVMLAIDAALAGKSVGVFSPTYKFLGPLLEPIVAALYILPNTSINRALGEIRLDGGGAIDLWSLDHTARAGRGRKYHLALIDESAHDEDRLTDSFPSAIAPALLDYAGSVVAASTPNGLEGWFHEIVHDPRHGFVFHHAPTSANPHLPVEEIAALRATLRAEIASQELDALFLDTGGATIFPLATLLIDGEPHPDDFPCQAIGLAIDSNSGKGGPDRDGCAAVIFALTMPSIARGSFEGARVVLLDWDIQSLAHGGVAPWLSHMRDRAVAWFRRFEAASAGRLWRISNPAGNGYAITSRRRARSGAQSARDRHEIRNRRQGRAGTNGRAALDRRPGKDWSIGARAAVDLSRRRGQPLYPPGDRVPRLRQGRLQARGRSPGCGDVCGAGRSRRRDRGALVEAQARCVM